MLVPAATSPASQALKQRTRREAAGAAQRSGSPTCPCRGVSTIRPFRALALEGKEVLPAAARALGLTIQPREVRAADGFERLFAALSRERPDGLYVRGGPLMSANQKRIIGFALKSRLPSVYSYREGVDAGGLMSYGADLADSYRRVCILPWTEF